MTQLSLTNASSVAGTAHSTASSATVFRHCFGASRAVLLIDEATTVVTISWQGSLDGTTFFNIYDKTNTQVTTGVGASRWVNLPAEILTVPYLRAVANTSSEGVEIIAITD